MPKEEGPFGGSEDKSTFEFDATKKQRIPTAILLHKPGAAGQLEISSRP